jgi:hypothetical protein
MQNMYKRKRVNSEDSMEDNMEDSQDNNPTNLVTPSDSNSSFPSTSNTENSANNTIDTQPTQDSRESSSTETLADKFSTAKFLQDTAVTEAKPSTEALFRTLRNIRGKTVQCEHHISNMENHIMNGTAPRGLSSNIQPNVPSIDTILIRQWEGVKLEYQSKLLICLRDFWTRHHQSLLHKCESLEEELKSCVSSETWNKMNQQIESTMQATKNNYNKPRRPNNPRGKQGGLSREINGRN